MVQSPPKCSLLFASRGRVAPRFKIKSAARHPLLRFIISSGKKLSRGGGRTDQLGKKKHPAVIGKQSDFGEVLSKRRVFGGNANVRGQRNVQARARRGAVYRGDHWLA